MKYGSLAVAAVLGLSVGCTTVDDSLGLDLIPDNQKIELKIASFSDVAGTYVAMTDSIPTNYLGVALLGNRMSPTFGALQCSAILQYTGYPFTDEEIEDGGFGYRPVMDSLMLYLNVNYVSDKDDASKYDAGQRFNIYEVTDKIKNDSVYFQTYPAETVSDMSEPLFWFEWKGKGANYGFKLKTTARGETYMQKLVDAGTDVYANDTLFVDMFKGFYIAPDPASTKNGVVYNVNLLSSNTRMVACIHNYDKETLKVKDTLTKIYIFADTYVSSYDGSKGNYYNTSINKIVHDYTGTPIHGINDTVRGSATVNPVYVQGYCGVYTYLRIRQQFIDQVMALKTQDGTTYSNIVINNAKIVFPVDDRTVPAYNLALSRLGMMYDYTYSSLKWIPDYNIDAISNGSTIPYGGYLNRSHGAYEMDITVYVQRLIDNKPSAQRTIHLVPHLSQNLGQYGEVVIGGAGSAAGAPRIELIYTLVR